jgi:Zn-dependent peptidase ImmA (M78 family)
MSINVRFMPDEEIEAEASALLASYARKSRTAIAVPALLLDDLLQHLGLRFEIYDLRKELQTPDVLGAIYLEQKLIRIDETLDPDVRPAMLGRFNFSYAHEIGHWCLHRGYAELRQAIQDLFGGPAKPSIICRTSQQKERGEIQADKFASYALMPRMEVAQAWQREIGPERFRLSTLGAKDRQELFTSATFWRGRISTERKQQYDDIIELTIAPIAKTFQVSPQAMRIRLERLGWIVRDVDEQESLFGAT